jgi:aconitate hydratase
MPKLEENLLVRLTAVIRDPVTTTDELIPSGETSSYRSNPEALSEFALSRRAPAFVGKSKAVRAMEIAREAGDIVPEVKAVLEAVGAEAENTSFGGCLYATKPGDGSAREQAASCQKVLGGFANICVEYATKRYRSNCINWGLVPFTCEADFPYEEDAWVYIPGIRSGILSGKETFEAKVITEGKVQTLTLNCKGLTNEEKLILTEGCLMNYYAAGYGSK